MPRDFVPCMYHERYLYDVRLDAVQRRCEVTELFALSVLPTQEQIEIVSGDSHAYFLDPAPEDESARARLFYLFYTRMADLE